MARWPTYRIARPAEVDLARLAAFIDGEGCITIRRGRGEPKGRRRTHSYNLDLVITNTDPRIVNWCKRTFAGAVYTVKQMTARNKHLYRWMVHQQMAREILNLCYPYLIAKKEQADLAFAFMETFDGERKYFRLVNGETIATRERLHLELKSLKATPVSASIQ